MFTFENRTAEYLVEICGYNHAPEANDGVNPIKLNTYKVYRSVPVPAEIVNDDFLNPSGNAFDQFVIGEISVRAIAQRPDPTTGATVRWMHQAVAVGGCRKQYPADADGVYTFSGQGTAPRSRRWEDAIDWIIGQASFPDYPAGERYDVIVRHYTSDGHGVRGALMGEGHIPNFAQAGWTRKEAR